MACTSPNLAVNLFTDSSGKMHIKFLPKRLDTYAIHQAELKYGKENVLRLPCGKCLSCRLAKSKEWAVRCVLEAKSHEYNFFLTLTFDNEHIGDNKLTREDLSKFIKRARYYFPDLRYFGCGEYGSTTNRKHHHIILFNCKIDDLEFFSRSDNGNYYTSKTISKLWPFGHVLITEFSYSTAAYIARYTLKKIFSDDNKDEFICMSLKPGLGYSYFEKNYSSIYDTDTIYGDFGNSNKARPPRYFDKLLELINPELFAQVKKKRLSCNSIDELDFLIKNDLSHFEDQYKVKAELIALNQKNKFKRGL